MRDQIVLPNNQDRMKARTISALTWQVPVVLLILGVVLAPFVTFGAPVPRGPTRPTYCHPVSPGATWKYTSAEAVTTKRIDRAVLRNDVMVLSISAAEDDGVFHLADEYEVTRDTISATFLDGSKLHKPLILLQTTGHPQGKWEIVLALDEVGILGCATLLPEETVTVGQEKHTCKVVDYSFTSGGDGNSFRLWFSPTAGIVKSLRNHLTKKELLTFSQQQ